MAGSESPHSTRQHSGASRSRASLGLAGVGPDRTRLEIWADPALDRNTHTIVVDSDSARFTMTIENVPSEENPGTGKITALSVIATLRGLVAPLRVGT